MSRRAICSKEVGRRCVSFIVTQTDYKKISDHAHNLRISVSKLARDAVKNLIDGKCKNRPNTEREANIVKKTYDIDNLGGATLRCAHCDGEYLHDTAIVFHNREKEDDDSVAHILYGSPMHIGQNPSSRRHGFTMSFQCEDCDGISQLTIAQHKGSTIVNFVQGPADHGLKPTGW